VSYDPTIVLPFGARVRLVSIDDHGLTGRDLHPEQSDLGFVGVITANLIEVGADLSFDVKPGTGVPEGAIIVYTVRAPEGKLLEVASYEVEPV